MKNPLKRKKVPQLQFTKEKEKEKPKQKKDWFEVSLIMFIGTMIGASIVYLLVTYS